MVRRSQRSGFTFLVLFRTGKNDCNPTGSEGGVNSDGTVTTFKEVYHLGEFKVPLTLETKGDPKTGEVSSRKVTVGDVEVPDKGPGVVVVDLTGEKPAYKLVKAELPPCKIDLADKERKTWPKAIDEAIAELKKKSKDLATLAD